jgi:hypothetical protein
MKIVEPSVIEYTTGLKMVDLSKSILQKTEGEDKKKPNK